MSEGFENLSDDIWDEELARDLVGATLLVGLTYLNSDGDLIRRQQVFGTVLSCDPEAGIAIATKDGQEPFTIAPVLEAIEVGDPGVYQMADEDEVVTNPDFIALMTVTAPLRT